MFAIAELLGFGILYLTWKSIFSLFAAALIVLTMLALSFHVMARDPKPDSTSIRMACFAAILFYGSILSGSLFFEFRSFWITTGSGLFCLITGVIGAFAAVSVLERPLDYDVEEID